MRLAAHQPNFMPWFPFFEKIHLSDIFVILGECQYEKGGYQNRARINDKWITKPIKQGMEPIKEKKYTDGHSLIGVNTLGIYYFCQLLGIDTKKIRRDFLTDKTGTDRIIEVCQHYGADEYLTNIEAINKYLEVEKFKKAGIKLAFFVPSSKKHTMELILEEGIEKTRRRLGCQQKRKQQKRNQSQKRSKSQENRYSSLKRKKRSSQRKSSQKEKRSNVQVATPYSL